jgi:hypothetical protein
LIRELWVWLSLTRGYVLGFSCQGVMTFEGVTGFMLVTGRWVRWDKAGKTKGKRGLLKRVGGL